MSGLSCPCTSCWQAVPLQCFDRTYAPCPYNATINGACGLWLSITMPPKSRPHKPIKASLTVRNKQIHMLSKVLGRKYTLTCLSDDSSKIWELFGQGRVTGQTWARAGTMLVATKARVPRLSLRYAMHERERMSRGGCDNVRAKHGRKGVLRGKGLTLVARLHRKS